MLSVVLPAVAPLPLAEPLAEVLSFAGSDEEEALDEDDGALVEPPEALLFGASVEDEALDEEDGGVALPDIEPEVELSFFFDASIETELDVEPEPEGAVEAEPEGVVVELDDEDEPAPDGVVVVLETARSPSRSQPVSMPAPSARETATAKVVSFISAMSSVGWGDTRAARHGPATLRP